MGFGSSNPNQFLHTGMTPRAWRMISYSCVGFCIYGLILLTETLQNYKLNKIDAQLQQIYQQEQTQTERIEETNPSPPQ